MSARGGSKSKQHQPSSQQKQQHKQATVDELYKELSDTHYKVDPDTDESAEFVARCLALCTQYDISAADFCIQFDAWRFTNKLKKCSMQDMDRFALTIGEKVEAERRKAAQKRPGGQIRIKQEPTTSRSSLASSQRTSATQPSALVSSDDLMSDLFEDDAIVVKKEPIDSTTQLTQTQTVTQASPAKRKTRDTQSTVGEEEQKDGGSKRTKENGEEEDANGDVMTDTPAGTNTQSTSAASSAHSLSFRPSFAFLSRDANGARHEALYVKALGKYVTRQNAGEKMTALNEYNLARIEGSEAEPSAEEQAENAKRIVEIEVFQPEDTEEDEATNAAAAAAAAITMPPRSKYASKNTRITAQNSSSVVSAVFRYMYTTDDELRETIESRIGECQEIMMEKQGFKEMRMLIKNEATSKPTLAQMTVQKEIVVKKEPELQEEKKDENGDVTMTDASSPPSSSPAAASSSSSPTASSAAAAITISDNPEDEEDSNLVPLVSIGSSKSQQSVLLCGRIVYNAGDTNANSELSQKFEIPASGLVATVWLEGDKRRDAGARIEMKLVGLSNYALFPGQVVLAKGINASGQSFAAEEIFTDASLPHFGVSREHVSRFNASLGFRPLGIMFAAGPFTTTEDLSYAPLFDLLRQVTHIRPEVLILQGPFIDSEHPVFLANEASVGGTYEQLFVRLLNDIMKHVAHLKTKVMIIPSLKCAAAIPVFPQPAYQLTNTSSVVSELQRDIASGKLNLLPNPCTFRVNDIVVGCSSLDIITYLTTSNEVCKSSLPPEKQLGRLQRLSSHLITSHSFFPLFPAPQDVSMDYSHASAVQMRMTPDLMFLPSKMKNFASHLDTHSTVVVNPEYLTKGPNGGTYALVSIHPLKDEEMIPPAGSINGRIYDHCMMSRTRVDVIRV